MKELVGAGLGCSVLLRMALRGRHEPFIVRSLKPRLYRKLALVMRRDKLLTKGLRELTRAIAAQCAMMSSSLAPLKAARLRRPAW